MKRSAWAGVFLGFGVSLSSAQAAPECAKVERIRGDNCKNLSIKVDLHECEDGSFLVEDAKIVSCSTDKAKAEFKTSNFTYTILLSKTQGAWESEWRADTGVIATRLPKKKKAAEPAPEAKVERPVAPPVVVEPAPVREEKLEAVAVSGFADAQYRWRSARQYSLGFVLQDAALYLASVSGPFQAKLDLPFSMKSPDSTTGNGANTDFAFAKTRAQAYVQYQPETRFRVKVGQFDTSYGIEANDTVDNFFSRQGHVYTFCDPFVHTGVQAAYDLNSLMTVNALLGNPADTGIGEGKNPQSGLQAVYNGTLRGSLGFLYQFSDANRRSEFFYSGTIGASMGAFSVDFEAALTKIPGSTYTGGYLTQAIYSLSDRVSAGVRGEIIRSRAKREYSEASTSPTSDRQYTVAIGPSFKLSERVKFRADYTYQWDRDPTSEPSLIMHGANASLVYRF